jgi:hypothetical protein
MFMASKANKMYIDGVYTKIIYTHNYFTLNGLWIELPISVQSIEKTNSHYYQVKLSASKNHDSINHNISQFEKKMLQIYQNSMNIFHKKPSYVLYNQFILGHLKIHNGIPSSMSIDHNRHCSPFYYIKISGIWETPEEFGITYKIFSKYN